MSQRLSGNCLLIILCANRQIEGWENQIGGGGTDLLYGSVLICESGVTRSQKEDKREKQKENFFPLLLLVVYSGIFSVVLAFRFLTVNSGLEIVKEEG